MCRDSVLTDVLGLLRKNVSRKVLVETPKLAANVSRLCGLYVEKLYQGFFFAGAKALFDFLLEAAEQLSEGLDAKRLPDAFPLLVRPLSARRHSPARSLALCAVRAIEPRDRVPPQHSSGDVATGGLGAARGGDEPLPGCHAAHAAL